MRLRAPSSLPLLPVPVIVALLAGLVPHGAGAATALANLDPGVREEIVRRCLPAQYREGADAYRNCVTDGVAAREDGAGASDALDALSIDDRYAIERACTGDDDCVASELAALEEAPDPFVDELARDERHALRRECFAVQGRDGVAAYRRCLDEAVAALETLPTAELASLTLLERNALALRCSDDAGSAVDYRRCLLEGSGTDIERPVAGAVADAASDGRDDGRAGERATDGGAAITVGRGTPAPDGEPIQPPETAATVPPDAVRTGEDGASGDVADGRAAPDDSGVRRPATPAAALPDADEAVRTSPEDGEATVARQSTGRTGEEERAVGRATGQAAAEADADDPADVDTSGRTGEDDVAGPEETAPDMRRRLEEARARLTATVAGLDGTERIVLGAALALPLLLLGVWAATRGGPRRRLVEVDLPPIRNPDLVGRVSPLQDDVRLDDTADEDFLGGLDLDEHPPPETGRSAEASTRSPPPPFRQEGTPDVPPPSAAPADAGPDGEADPAGTDPAFVPRSTFGRRLLAGDESLARRHAIEFLIYWMAYADERYEPGMRDALLRDGGDDGDPHDLIKRHVLEEDTLAFADAVRWLQHGTHELQRVQIIDLLMVLLISEAAMTPSQNTLLHFLADAFGLGPRTLGARHEQAFGTPMPALARTDLAGWWERVEPDRPIRWDARAVAGLDEERQFRIRLGLPLEGEIDEEAIVEGFRRAARRCHPHRFDELGERERALAERQFAKFEEARDGLLEVSA